LELEKGLKMAMVVAFGLLFSWLAAAQNQPLDDVTPMWEIAGSLDLKASKTCAKYKCASQ
jgi:hypothetical protein